MRRTLVAPQASPSANSAPIGLDDPKNVLTTLNAVLATGAPEDEALALVIAAHGLMAVRSVLLERIVRIREPRQMVALLDRIAGEDPGLAMAGLLAWGTNRTVTGRRLEQRNLDLDERHWVTGLPEGLTVRGNLSLVNCGALQGMPAALQVGGDLTMSGCHGVDALPQDLSVGGSLDLNSCNRLRSLPDALRIGDYLTLYACVGLTNLPGQLQVGRSLNLEYCENLNRLPPDLLVGGALCLNASCPLSALSDRELHAMAPGIAGQITRE
jgi:hypothetical protein